MVLAAAGVLLGVVMAQAPMAASSSGRTWFARVGNAGTMGSNGSATLTASWTGTGTLELRLFSLRPGVSYALSIFRGPSMPTGTSWSSSGSGCAEMSDGELLRLPAVRTSGTGSVTRTLGLSEARMTLLQALPRKLAVGVGGGSLARCGSLSLQLPPAPTPTPSIASPTPSSPPVCAPWPAALRDVLAVLSTPAGLCLVWYTDPTEAPAFVRAAGGYYFAGDPPTVQYLPRTSGDVEFRVLAHEVCHAHQDRVARDAGLPALGGWYRTAAGEDFVRVTGWAYRAGRWVARVDAGYTDPIQDNADTCAIWFDPAAGPRWLRRWAPERWDWAQRWLPLPAFIVPWPASPAG